MAKKQYISVTTLVGKDQYTATAIRIVGEEVLESVIHEVGPFETRRIARDRLDGHFDKEEWERVPTTGRWRIE